MLKRKLCGATTNKGTRCRNPGSPNPPGRCAVHAKVQRVRDKAVAARSVSRPRITLTLSTTVAAIDGAVVDVPEAIAQVIGIVEFVGNHWPQVHRLARHRVLKPKPNTEANLIKDCQRMIKSGSKDANLAARFERWFESLPSPVKVVIETEFGDVRSIIGVLRVPRESL